MLVTSSALDQGSHLYSSFPDDDVTTCLILSNKPSPSCSVLNSKWQCRPVNVTLLALGEVITGRKNQKVLCVRLIYKPPARGHDGKGGGHTRLQPFLGSSSHLPHTHVPCHVLYSTRVREQNSGGLNVMRPAPFTLSNRLWLSEAGAFLQFIPTSLLNHLHYLTVFPQRELQLSLCKFDESVHAEKQPGKRLLWEWGQIL